MQEVVFQNGKLVLQKRKISQMDESFLIASKALDKKKELELERLKDGGFNNLVKDFLFVEDSVFETMNTYFPEEKLNIQRNESTTKNDIETTVMRRPNNNMMSLHTKNRPDGTKLGLIDTTVSSNPQKKYALLAQASYLEGDKDKIDKLIQQNKDLYGFKLDESLSSQKNSVFVNPNSG